MDKEAVLKLGNLTQVFKFLPAAKSGFGMASSFLKHRRAEKKISVLPSKKQAEWIAAAIFVALCIIKRILKR